MMKKLSYVTWLIPIGLMFMACSSDKGAADTGQASSSFIEEDVLRQADDEFAQIKTDLDTFHVDFDRWREDSISCHVSSFQETVKGFTGVMTDIDTSVRNLPRGPIVRDMTDELIATIAQELQTFIELRDKSTTYDRDLFRGVDIARAKGSEVRQRAEDELTALQLQTDTSSRAQIQMYRDAFDRLDRDWDIFHDSYEEFRQTESGIPLGDVSRKLSGLVASSARLLGKFATCL